MIATIMIVLTVIITSAPAGYLIHKLFEPLARDASGSSAKDVVSIAIITSLYTLAYVVVICLGMISVVAGFFDIGPAF